MAITGTLVSPPTLEKNYTVSVRIVINQELPLGNHLIHSTIKTFNTNAITLMKAVDFIAKEFTKYANKCYTYEVIGAEETRSTPVTAAHFNNTLAEQMKAGAEYNKTYQFALQQTKEGIQ